MRASSSPHPRRAVLYARQSLTRDGSDSLATQAEVCRRAAYDFGLDVVAELVEPPSTSGFKNRGRGRPMFTELLRLIGARRADAVVVYTTDRLSRGGGPGWAPLVDAFERAGIDIDQAVLTAAGWVSEVELSLRAVFDREESKKLSMRMRDVRARQAHQGTLRSAGARPGYGYTRNLAIVPSEARVIRAAVDRVAAGDPFAEIARQWRAEGVPTRSGGRWDRNRVSGILVSGRIAGLITLHGEVVAKAPWPAIITEEQHRLMRALAMAHAKRVPVDLYARYPLLAFARCGVCEDVLRPNFNGAGHRIYNCTAPHPAGGLHPTIKADFLETLAGEQVCAVLARRAGRRAALARMTVSDSVLTAELVERLAAISDVRSRLHLDASPQRDRGRARSLGIQALALEEALFAGHPDNPPPDVPSTLHGLHAAWAEGTVAYRRALLRATIDRVVVDPSARPGTSRIEPERVRWSFLPTRSVR